MPNTEKKKKNRFARALHFIFIRNWGLKLTAVITAVGLWVLSVGLL